MKKADKENERFSGGNPSGSVGTDSGSASGSGGNGSDRGIDGSGRSVDGNARGIDGSGNGNDGSADFGSNGSDNVSEPIGTDNANVESVSDNRNVTDSGNGGKRQRIGKPIRLGNFRDRNSDTSADDGNDDGIDGTENRNWSNDSEPVIRLGARAKEKPRSNIKDDSAETVFEIGKTKDLIKVFLNSVFEIPAISLKQDFWRLSKDESNALTDALIEYLKSMPKSKASKLAQFLKENLPLVNLAMIAFFIVSERVRASMAIATVTKAGKAFEKQASAATNVTPNNGVVTPLDSIHSVN